MLLGFTICMAMCGSGLLIAGMTITKALQAMGVLGKVVIARGSCCAAARGTVVLGACACLSGAGTLLRAGTTATAFDWPRTFKGAQRAFLRLQSAVWAEGPFCPLAGIRLLLLVQARAAGLHLRYKFILY